MNTMFANALILEKSENIEDVTNNLIKILKNTTKVKMRENLKRIVSYLFGNIEEVIKIIEKYEEEESMLTAKRIIDIEFKKQRREGKREGRMEGLIEMMANVIKNMLLQNEDEEKIMKYTNAKKEDIEKVRKELEDEKA